MGNRLAAVALSLALGGCASGPPSSEPAPVLPPTGLVATEGLTFDAVELSWRIRCATCTGYVLEASFDGITYDRINQDLIPPWATGVLLAFDPTAPELLRVWFRVQAWRDTASSPWSEVATYFRGIRPPSISISFAPPGPPAISWTNHSQVADALRLERAEAGPTGPGTWTSLPVAFGATSYEDADNPELQSCYYRVRYGKGDDWSRESSLLAGPFPLRQPLDVRAELTPAGVALSWTNRSAAATGIAVHCSLCAGGATLPPDASTYVDPWVPPWPSVRYWVEAFQVAPVQTSGPGLLPVAELPPFRIAGPVATLDARAASLPPSVDFRGDPRGAFAYTTYVTGGAEVVRSDGATEDRHPLPHTAFIPPGLLLDGAGNPHVVTRGDFDAPGFFWLAHDWHDGSAWHTEDIGPFQGSSWDARFGLGIAGDLHILYLQADGSFDQGLTHGVRADGTWSWSPVPGLHRGEDFAVAADGTAYVLDGQVLATLPAGGAWAVEEIPGGPAVAKLVTGPAGRIGILGRDSAVGFDQHVRYVERTSGTWSTTETVGPVAASFPAFSWASSADGARLHVAASVPDGNPREARVDLFGRSAGTWTSMRLAPTAGAPLLGYGADGKLWIAGNGLWEEP